MTAIASSSTREMLAGVSEATLLSRVAVTTMSSAIGLFHLPGRGNGLVSRLGSERQQGHQGEGYAHVCLGDYPCERLSLPRHE